MSSGFILFSLIALLSLTAVPSFAQEPELEHFERRVRPILVNHCIPCHGPGKQESGLRLDSREHLLAGGTLAGPAVLLRKTHASPLLLAIQYKGDLQMPPNRRLAANEVRDLQQWVLAGAPGPKTPGENNPVSPSAAWDSHWAATPFARPVLPPGTEASPIDRFIAARLKARQLTFSPPADAHMPDCKIWYDSPETVATSVESTSHASFAGAVPVVALTRGRQLWGRTTGVRAPTTSMPASANAIINAQPGTARKCQDGGTSLRKFGQV